MAYELTGTVIPSKFMVLMLHFILTVMVTQNMLRVGSFDKGDRRCGFQRVFDHCFAHFDGYHHWNTDYTALYELCILL
jgi:hypothetical protein